MSTNTSFMLKRSILILVASLSITSLFSQKEFQRYSEYGIKGGVYSIEHQINKEGGNGESIPFIGTALGFQFIHMEQKNLGLVVELNYSQQSYNENQQSLSASTITLPLLSHFSFNIGKSNVALNVGPYLTTYLSKPEEVVLDKDFLYGMAGGLSFSYPIGKVILGLEGRYYYTLPLNSDDYRGSIRGSWTEVALSIALRKYKD